jgi:hypothetical protein
MIGLEALGMSLEDIFITVVDNTEDNHSDTRYTRNTQKRERRSRTTLEKDLADNMVKEAAQRRADASQDEEV